MPRTSRVVVPGYPHHIVRRGHNRSPVFIENSDYRFYLRTLSEWKARLGCKVYAFCLMTNHVHLIVDPGDRAENLGRLMKRLAGRYTRHVNRAERRSGTAWDSRFKSSLVETDTYLLACCRYVELNPVRAGIVTAPEHYAWSSCLPASGTVRFPWVDENPLYRGLGNSHSEHREAYRAWLLGPIPEGEWERIRLAVRRGQVSGSPRFLRAIGERLGRRLEFRGRGRPPKRKARPDVQ